MCDSSANQSTVVLTFNITLGPAVRCETAGASVAEPQTTERSLSVPCEEGAQCTTNESHRKTIEGLQKTIEQLKKEILLLRQTNRDLSETIEIEQPSSYMEAVREQLLSGKPVNGWVIPAEEGEEMREEGQVVVEDETLDNDETLDAEDKALDAEEGLMCSGSQNCQDYQNTRERQRKNRDARARIARRRKAHDIRSRAGLAEDGSETNQEKKIFNDFALGKNVRNDLESCGSREDAHSCGKSFKYAFKQMCNDSDSITNGQRCRRGGSTKEQNDMFNTFWSSSQIEEVKARFGNADIVNDATPN
jgi:hypothetical protein